MNLHFKLLAAFLGFIIALILLGAWSARQIDALGRVSAHILAHNYDSVVATQDIKESLERIDDAADSFALRGERESAANQIDAHRRRFDQAFLRAANNITEPGEPAIISDIKAGRDDYFAALFVAPAWRLG